MLTVSDSVAQGKREDVSGAKVAGALAARGFEVVARACVADERAQIEEALRRLALQARLVVTTGGTGLAPRDVTPEATRAVCERLVDGVAERMRAAGAQMTPLAILSRGVCGVIGQALVLNLPGSPNGAVESLHAVADVLPHALELLAGRTDHS